MTSDPESRRADGSDSVAEARWQAIVASAVDGIIVIDARGRIEVFNPAAQRMFGYSEAEVLGRNVAMLMPEPDRSEHDRYIERHLTTGERRVIGIGRTVTGQRRDGQTFPLHLSVGELAIDGEKHFTGILHDLSSRADLEDRVRESAAMARLGEMAAVIAHEVKNPLAAVRGAIQVIGGRMSPSTSDAEIVKAIVARLDGLNELIQDLLVFARPPAPKRRWCGLRELVDAVAELLKADPVNASLEVSVSGTVPALSVDPVLMTIVFQNLMTNAAQAMQGSGTIAVALDTIDGCHRVTVTDAGPGIPAEIRAALFRPFKTTKARGTGLGMATAKQLVESHGGRISVECPADGGTTIVITLPSSDDAADPQASGFSSANFSIR